ncbi:helix-turn-helix domain-containing protein [Telmatobacter bradus]|uniref:AlbA family DNA-binding domain-containing protein n=1 Tax=Telmatobacter bradus TaxID=474953 RepID=UPI003B439840
MSERAELLFKRLQNAKAIRALIGQAEDGDFDCKEWHGADSMKASVAKAACGFANATGGVIVVGMTAKSSGPNTSDVVTGEKPVADREAVKSAVLDIILKQVDPGVTGVRAHTVPDKPKAKSGFVLLYIPEMDGSPQRSRQDWRFYVRIASGTVPMEYFQIADRFGSRPHPKLELIFDERHTGLNPYRQPERNFVLGLKNTGRSIARFPAVWFLQGTVHPDTFGIDGNTNFGLPRRPSEDPLIIFAGGVDNVIFPGQELVVAKLAQAGTKSDPKPRQEHTEPVVTWASVKTRYVFPAFNFTCSISCEGCPTEAIEKIFGATEFNSDF